MVKARSFNPSKSYVLCLAFILFIAVSHAKWMLPYILQNSMKGIVKKDVVLAALVEIVDNQEKQKKIYM